MHEQPVNPDVEAVNFHFTALNAIGQAKGNTYVEKFCAKM